MREWYKKYDIYREYDDPDSYGEQESYYGDGKYPPDWNERRQAVWDQQDYQCARCRVYKGNVDGAAMHHIEHLNMGGSNRLRNLAGLCSHCHALMHPDVNDLDGSIQRAPVFPHSDARDEVAVIKMPDDQDLRTDLSRYIAGSAPGRNSIAASSSVVFSSSPYKAKRADTHLHDTLISQGHIPRTSDYSTVTIKPEFPGLQGTFSMFDPPVRVNCDGDLVKIGEWSGWFNKRRVVRYSEDCTQTTIKLQDGTGAIHKETLRLPRGETHHTIRPQLPAPRNTLLERVRSWAADKF